MLSAALVGLGALVATLGPMLLGLKFIGAAYLLWLGIKKWRNAGRMLAAGDTAKPASFLVETGLGLAMTLSNPLALVFYVALLPGVIDVSGISLGSYAILCSIVVAVMAAIVAAYGVMAELARKQFASSSSKARIDRTSGAMMAGAALLIATR